MRRILILLLILSAFQNVDAENVQERLKQFFQLDEEQLKEPAVQMIITGNIDAFRSLLHSVSRQNKFYLGEKNLLHVATVANRTKFIDHLVNKGADINALHGKAKLSPLHAATGLGLTGAVSRLLFHGANTEKVMLKGLRPLHIAVQQSNVGITDLLLDAGADIDAKTPNQMTPLMLMVYKNDPYMVTYLVDRGASLNEQDARRDTALHAAVNMNRTDLVTTLVRGGVDTEVKNKKNKTALMIAAYNNQFQNVQILLDAGADVEAIDHKGRSALFYAMYDSHLDIIQLLFDAGAYIYRRKTTDGSSLVHEAVLDGAPKALDWLLKKGLNINDSDNDGDTPAMYAAYNENVEMLEALVVRGAKIDKQTMKAVVSEGTREQIKLLMDHGMPIDMFTEKGQSLLVCAIRYNNVDNLSFLLEQGLNPDIAMKGKFSALASASWHGNEQSASLLLNYGANPNLGEEKMGQTALHVAARRGQYGIAKLLLENGAHPAPVMSGLKPWHYADMAGHKKVADLIASYCTTEQLLPTNRVSVYFDYDAPFAETVTVMGLFNEWNKVRHPLSRREDDGWWYAEVEMYPGTYKYKFVVDGVDTLDPENKRLITDSNMGYVDNGFKTEGREPHMRPVRLASDTGAYVKIDFTYSNVGARTVCIAGEFNGWSSDSSMSKNSNGIWEKTLFLKPGDYGYKFVVDGEWILDPANRETKQVDDVANSLVKVKKRNHDLVDPPGGLRQ